MLRHALLALLLLVPHRALAAKQQPTGIDPARTYALVVGVLEWQKAEDWESFEATYRRDAMLVEHLKQRGITGKRLIYLQDKAATLPAIRANLAKQIGRAGAGDTLLVYYCGHGFLEAGEGYFANYDSGDTRKTWWSMRELVDTIQDTFKGGRALLFVDCCHSGRLVEEVSRRSPTRIAYGVFTSSSAEETSTGNWTFTQALYDALTGSPLVDRNRDGAVTAAELGDHAADEMTVFEGQRNAVGMVGGFDAGTVLSRTPGKPVPARYGERVKVWAEGEWWNGRIVDIQGDEALVRWVAIGFDTADSDEWHKVEKCKPLKLVQYPAGKAVMVKWKRKWYPARVKEVRGAQHFIHYDGEDAEWDEWVGPGRIRPPRKPRK